MSLLGAAGIFAEEGVMGSAVKPLAAYMISAGPLYTGTAYAGNLF